jgi:hypothetical protein
MAGEPEQAVAGGPPPTAVAQIGHGCAGWPVSTVAEFSWKTQLAAPVDVSSVPVGPAQAPVPIPVQQANGFPAPRHRAFGKNVFVTHTESPAFEIGSGVPNWHPAAVQSTPGGVVPAAVVPSVQAGPTHDSVKRFVAPGGVALSGTCESPPPSESWPQRRFFSGIVPATSRNVFPHVPVPAVDRKSNPDGPVPVVEVVDVDVDEVVELDVEEVVEDDVEVLEVDELVDDEVDELVELDVELEVDELVDDVVGMEVDVLVEELVDEDEVDVDEVLEDEVDVELDEDELVELLVLVLVDVLVVVGFVTTPTSSSTQFSTTACRVAVSSKNWQSFGFLFSSFSKQPLVGSRPPLNFAFALSMQPPAFGSAGFPGVWASWWHLRSPFRYFETHFFLPAPHFV